MQGGNAQRAWLIGLLIFVVLGVGAFVFLSSDDEDGSERLTEVAPADEAAPPVWPDPVVAGADEPEPEVEPVPPGTSEAEQAAEGLGGEIEVGSDGGTEEPPEEPDLPPLLYGVHVRPMSELGPQRDYPQPETGVVRIRPERPGEQARRGARIEQAFDRRLTRLREQAQEANASGDQRRAADLDDMVQRMERSREAYYQRRAAQAGAPQSD